MSRCMRVIGIIALASILSGCASYRPAVLPSDGPSAGGNSGSRRAVYKGANVRVTTNDGEVLSGEVIRVAPKEIVIGRPGNYGHEEERVYSRDIDSIVMENSSSGEKTVMYVIGGLIVIVIGGAVAIGHGLSNMGE